MVTSITDELKSILKPEQVRTDPESLGEHAVDGIQPAAVLFPQDTAQVAAIVQYADKNGLALLPWGAGTKIGAGYPPKALDLVLDTSRLNHMLDVDSDNLTITVEAGVRFRDIQARLATQENRCYLPIEYMAQNNGPLICSERSYSGCFLALDPPHSAKATIGGILAANSTGPKRLLYGTPRDIVLGVRFVAANGDIIGSGGKTVKNVSGYDISKLMIGSYGTLGVLCETTLRLLPLPEEMKTLLLVFDTFDKAAAFTTITFNSPLLPAAVEFLNGKALSLIQTDGGDTGPGGYGVAVALEGFSEAVARMQEQMLAWVKKEGAQRETILSESEHRIFWLNLGDIQTRAARHYSNTIALKLSYPISAWTDMVPKIESILNTQKIHYTLVCHAGSGIALLNLLPGDDADPASGKIEAAVNTLLQAALEGGGNLVVEAAPAGLKADLPLWGAEPPGFAAMQQIKKGLDPAGIMSPGRFVRGM